MPHPLFARHCRLLDQAGETRAHVCFVIPAKAGIHYGIAGMRGDAWRSCAAVIDPGLRRGDGWRWYKPINAESRRR